jgi:hypothetical protein
MPWFTHLIHSTNNLVIPSLDSYIWILILHDAFWMMIYGISPRPEEKRKMYSS